MKFYWATSLRVAWHRCNSNVSLPPHLLNVIRAWHFTNKLSNSDGHLVRKIQASKLRATFGVMESVAVIYKIGRGGQYITPAVPPLPLAFTLKISTFTLATRASYCSLFHTFLITTNGDYSCGGCCRLCVIKSRINKKSIQHFTDIKQHTHGVRKRRLGRMPG